MCVSLFSIVDPLDKAAKQAEKDKRKQEREAQKKQHEGEREARKDKEEMQREGKNKNELFSTIPRVLARLTSCRP